MRLRTRLFAMIVPTLIATVVLGSSIFAREDRRVTEMRVAAVNADLAVRASALVHEAQKERGMSSGFLASKGEKFRGELPGQRALTDRRAKELEQALEGKAVEPKARAALDHALATLSARGDLRARVDALAVTPRDAFLYYSGLVDVWLAVIEQIARDDADGVRMRRELAYGAFLRVKEQAGRGRATLNNVFAADAFDPELHRRLLSVIATEDAELVTFRAYASEAALAKVEALRDDDCCREAASLQALALERVSTGKFGVDPARWFGAATRRIDALKSVEDALATELLDGIVRETAVVERARAATATGLVVAVVLTGLLAAFHIRRVLRQIGGEPEEVASIARRVAEGDLVAIEADAPQGSVLQATRGMADRLRTIVGQTSDRLERLARGDVPERSTETWPGRFDALRVSMDSCADAIRALLDAATTLSAAAERGELDARADASLHQGDYRRVVLGINATLEALLRPVEEARHGLELLAQRDLAVRVQGSFRGDLARMKDAFNAATDALNEAFGGVAEAADQLASASSQIAAASQSVAAGATEQASALGTAHATLQRISEQARSAATDARRASTQASSAHEMARVGVSSMERLTAIMSRVRTSSEGTKQIVRDISEIAFQTNLLALNAAVEAARAGEAGLGFAVVAEEVRALAARAKEAARRTENLIQESVTEVTAGDSTARDAQARLEEILGAALTVDTLVVGIAGAADEQASAVDALNRAMSEMDLVTQQNAASSEEASATAQELSGQSALLARMVGLFHLERGPSSSRVTHE